MSKEKRTKNIFNSESQNNFKKFTKKEYPPSIFCPLPL
jgi:hypothetical protein